MTNIPTDVRRREFDDYLFTSLDEIVRESETPELAAYRIALVLSFSKENIDALRMDIYLSRVDLPDNLMMRALNYFAGTGLLSFEGHNPDSLSFRRGEADKRFGAKLYEMSKGRVEVFQDEFWSDTHE